MIMSTQWLALLPAQPWEHVLLLHTLESYPPVMSLKSWTNAGNATFTFDEIINSLLVDPQEHSSGEKLFCVVRDV